MTDSIQFEIPQQEHPFAPYVRILGKGRQGSRSLSREEARAAFGMLLRGEADPLQVGAFLMLLRVKEESGEELAGFVEACRENMVPPPPTLAASLDWSSYAGKRAQHPWYLLSMMLLAAAGHRVFVHGCDGHTAGRLYTEQAMAGLGLPVATDWAGVAQQLDQHQLSYLAVRHFCPALHQLIQLRPLLGLRSPVNTLTRMLNPLRADASLQSIFHPAYGQLHQNADYLLGQPRALVFKGDSGEVEIKPQADTRLQLLADGTLTELTLPRSLPDRVPAVNQPALEPVRALWQGRQDNDYGLQAVLATAAVALHILQPGQPLPDCQAQALSLWQARDRERLA